MKTKLIIIISGAVLISLVGIITPVVLFVGETVPPVLKGLEPFWNAVVSGTTEIHFNAIDAGDKSSGIRSYKIYINDELVSKTNSYSWDTTPFADGSRQTIEMLATDGKGNKASWINIVVVDNTIDSPPSDAFKVMVHNAWVSGTECLKLKTCTSWMDVLYEENADIMLISETGSFDNGRNMEVMTNQLSGYFYYEAPYAGNATDALATTDGVAIISRYPVLEWHEFPTYKMDDGTMHDYHRSWADMVVDIQGTPTHVIAYHGKCCISAVTNNTYMREREMEGIINYMDDIGDVPIIFGGDFNSQNHLDVGDLASVAQNLGSGPMRMLLTPSDPVYGEFSSKVHNFTDTWRTMYPTERGWTYGFTDPQYWGRIDYLLVNQHLADKMINGTVGDTPSANFTSDHYSVDAYFSLDDEYVFNTTSIRKSTVSHVSQVVTQVIEIDDYQRLLQSRIALVNFECNNQLRRFEF